MKTLKLRLLRTWNSRGAGVVLPSVPRGQAKLMIARGDAELVENVRHGAQTEPVEMSTIVDKKPKAKRTRKKKPAK